MTTRRRGRSPHPDVLTPAVSAVLDLVRHGAERFHGQTLGLPHVLTFGDLAFFDAGGVRLYLHRKRDADWRPSSVLYFTVDDIHATQTALGDAGVKFRGAPHVISTDDATGTEEWMTFFEDGEGNMPALMSRVSPI